MRISRLYTSQTLNVGQQLVLEDDSAHYVRSVLRLKKEYTVTLFNGQGGEYLCKIVELSRKKVIVVIAQYISRDVESPLNISLGLGISRGDRMDWAVQKSVELGINALTPLMTERCVIKLNEEKKQQKLQHWRNIAKHATEQCGRTILPNISDIDIFQLWLKKQSGLKVFLDPLADQSLASLNPIEKRITLLSGPEGGFSPLERECAGEAGFIAVRLGSRILRTETSALAALSAAQMLWGDFK